MVIFWRDDRPFCSRTLQNNLMIANLSPLGVFFLVLKFPHDHRSRSPNFFDRDHSTHSNQTLIWREWEKKKPGWWLAESEKKKREINKYLKTWYYVCHPISVLIRFRIDPYVIFYVAKLQAARECAPQYHRIYIMTMETCISSRARTHQTLLRVSLFCSCTLSYEIISNQRRCNRVKLHNGAFNKIHY
jgi:hypothetical protein